MNIKLSRLIATVGLCTSLALPLPSFAAKSHALSVFGNVKYDKNFTHFDYVNPNAPKGGTTKLHSSGGFDSLNPFIIKGLKAPGLSMMFESLMVGSLDEPQSYYGLIADSVDLAADKSSISFTINPKAAWHDGSPITVDDVIFSLNVLKEKGDPYYRLQYKPITKAEKTGARRVTFTFVDGSNRDLPFTVASMPILSKTYYETVDFEKSTLEPPMASGPYRPADIEANRKLTYKRVENYWGKDIPARKGQYNFDAIRFDVYRDETVGLEAFKAGEYDLREEYIARNWATAYNIPAVKEGRIAKNNIPHAIPRGMQGFVINLRKSKFKDVRVREAISMSMDFNWMNRALFFDAYERNDSFFQNTQFAAKGLPSKGELALLEPFREQLPPALFTSEYHPPTTDGNGNNRENLLRGQQLLNEAGWKLVDGKRIHEKTGEELTVEFMMRQRTFERVIAPMKKDLKRLGIASSFRLVDDSQYQKRVEEKDFDIISQWWNIGVIYPGNEQRQYWHSSQANVSASNNLSGIESPVIDTLLDKLDAAQTEDALRPAARALDRVLLWEHVFIPHWHISSFRTAYWNKFGIPKTRPLYGLGFDTWWIKPSDTQEGSK